MIAASLIIHWQIIHDKNFTDKKGMYAVKTTVTDALLSSAALQRSTDKQRQTIAENYAYQSMLALKTYQALKTSGDAKGLKDLSDMLAESVRKTGMNLRNIKLTSEGFTGR